MLKQNKNYKILRNGKNVPHIMKFKVLDLFSGAGGFSCGLDSLDSFETVIGSDFDPNVLVTFEKNIKGSIAINGDITDANVKTRIIDEAKKREVNMVIGGPPCQGFSLKGKNLGLDDPRNFLFLEYVKIVKELKPEVFVIENVKNLINACDGYFIKQILNEFGQLGYIINYGVLNAANFGVPQHRERAIIIGSLSKSISLPTPSCPSVTVYDAISDLAYLESGEGVFETPYKNKPKTEYQKMLRNKNGLLYNHVATSHSKVALEKLAMIPPEGNKSSLPKELHGKQKFATTWSRLVWNEQSPTIDTRFDTPSNGKNSHPFLNRAITPREAARIQSFPDSYVFFGKKVNVCKQIGNAVPPLLARAIGLAIEAAYKDESYSTGDSELFNGDSLSLVKELTAKGVKVDAVVTDPPYNISKENNFSTMNKPRKGVDFGKWDKNFNVCEWIDSYSKLVRKDGCMVIFCSYLFLSYVCDRLAENGFVVKDILIWKKSNPMPRNIERRYVQDMEFAVWAVNKKAKWTFNKPKNAPYLRSVFETPVVSGAERTVHPTQKSLRLMMDIIKIHTNPGDLIIDPFMGSGTTGVACKKLKRRFIGIELNKDFFEIAKNRISLTK